MRTLAVVVLASASFALVLPAVAQTGPVGTACAADISKFCAGKGHGNRQTRSCLEENREKLSQGCRRALDTTGGGRRRGAPQ
jgi:hypothetical protein